MAIANREAADLARRAQVAWYSARLSRCDGRQPGLGLRAAARSIFVSNALTSPLIDA
jgi:hypothetical protein